jgi:hypothetical protein
VLSQACEAAGKPGLDPRWVQTPVGGADKIGTFVSLLGANQLTMAALVDSHPRDKQRIQALQDNGHLTGRALIQMSEFTGTSAADTEDLFEPEFYLELVNRAYAAELAKPLKVKDLKSKAPRIVERVEQHFSENTIAGGKLNHYRPSEVLLREQVELLPKISGSTVERATALFNRLNDQLDA